MQDDRPGILWDGGWSLAAVGAVAAPVLVTPLVATSARDVQALAVVSGVVVWISVLIADLFIYLHWRMTGGRANWLVLALTVLTVESLAQATFVAVDPQRSETHPSWMLSIQILVALGVYAVVWLAPRHRLTVDPLLLGGVLGLCLVVLRSVVVTQTSSLNLGDDALQTLRLLALLIDIAIAVAIFRLNTSLRLVRARLAGTLLLLSIAHAASYPTPDGRVSGLVAIVCNVLGGAGLLALAMALVRLSWLDNRAALEVLGSRLEEVEADFRVEQARLHELRATAAGIGTASRLLHNRSAVSGPRRRQLEEMMDSEMGRLQRLLTDDAPGEPTSVDLDEIIRPIVAMHQARGYPVHWRPTGLRATGRPDDVAEVINVLLENAAQHAPHAGASITATQVGHVVEIAVADDGPGVEQGVVAKIFEWGERGSRSTGSGIGLNIARELTLGLGGYLTHVTSSGAGATFVLGLPSEENS